MFRLKTLVSKLLHYYGYEIYKIDPDRAFCSLDHIELLEDKDFKASVEEVRKHTLLDLFRLANLWQLCRRTPEEGALIEIGTYKGGGALHLSNCCPNRKIYICDSFQGFEKIDTKLDGLFKHDMFRNTSEIRVDLLFKNKTRNYEICAGFFPSSCMEKKMVPISFAHVDVDVYKATKETLDYLAPLMLPHSMIVIDDYLRNADGVVQATHEFLAKHPNWRIFPLFPGQGLLLS